jgi:hypothetical protein
MQTTPAFFGADVTVQRFSRTARRPFDQALFLQGGQIPVNGAPAHVFPHESDDLIGKKGLVAMLFQRIQQDFSLQGPVPHQAPPPIRLNLRLRRKFVISRRALFVNKNPTQKPFFSTCGAHV